MYVITSYSIHYTKLYDAVRGDILLTDRIRSFGHHKDRFRYITVLFHLFGNLQYAGCFLAYGCIDRDDIRVLLVYDRVDGDGSLACGIV